MSALTPDRGFLPQDSTAPQSTQAELLPNQHLIQSFVSARDESVAICKPLAIEDFVVQPRAEVSPPKWHLAHTTWFFEQAVLSRFEDNYQYFNDAWLKLFNSYYKSAGLHWLQSERGQLSRPTVDEVLEYRRVVDARVISLLERLGNDQEIRRIIAIGIHHEQQHQELLYMDIKSILGSNPLLPVYVADDWDPVPAMDSNWDKFDAALVEIGHSGNEFAYDNEGPRHKQYLNAFALRNNSVSNAEFLDFMADGAYEQASIWLSQGWDWVQQNRVQAPLYWFRTDSGWQQFTLHGVKPVNPNEPVTHVSYFEADAFARWAGYRLPVEAESETWLLGQNAAPEQDSRRHPTRVDRASLQVWHWTSSHYSAYPGYRPYEGMLEEYNGKFMCNQFVLRGGCVATPSSHYRPSYRNFFLPEQRWMFSGIKLARDI